MKQIRLEKYVDKKTFSNLISVYKEAKKTRNIHKILIFKSFITRIIEAEWEFDENGQKIWASLTEYTDFIMRRQETPLKFILNMAENEHAYGYEIKKHLRRTL